jgi:hypothetical protein
MCAVALFGGLWFGIGSAIILLVALARGVVGRHFRETRPERKDKNAAANELITRKA